MSAAWTLYLVVGLGVITLALLLVRELYPIDKPDEYWRVLDSVIVVLGIALVLALLLQFSVLSASV
jgi:heme/copper-type cytochrome/quinol oxidase subunit 4